MLKREHRIKDNSSAVGAPLGNQEKENKVCNTLFFLSLPREVFMCKVFLISFSILRLFHKVIFIHPSINTAADLRGILCLSKLSASVCVRGWEMLGGNHSEKQTHKKRQTSSME